MKTEKIYGDIVEAIEWIVYQLIVRNELELLRDWDQIRGNDWIVSTRLSEQQKNNE